MGLLTSIEVQLGLGDRVTDTVTVYRSRSKVLTQRWYWRRVATNGKKLSRSSEGYRDKSHAVVLAMRCNEKKVGDLQVEGGLADVTITELL